MAVEESRTAVRKLTQAIIRCWRFLAAAAVAGMAGLYLTSARWEAWLALALAAGTALALPPSRRWLLGMPRRWRTRRQVQSGLKAVANAVGSLREAAPPRIRRVISTPVGERVYLRLKSGFTDTLLENLSGMLRTDCRCRVVRLTRDPKDGSKVTLDIIRKDPFARGLIVRWLDAATAQLSGWDPVHLGTNEYGEDVRLSLVDRGLILGGLMGMGKSGFMQTIVAHFAKAGEHLVLIDPNQKEFGPWKHRAALFVTKDPTDVIAALTLVQQEVDRRMGLFEGLPGVTRNLTRELADRLGWRLILLAIDEMACITSVAGTGAQQNTINVLIRDILSRGRAVGVIVVGATQRPTQDVLPRGIVDLFLLRLALKTKSAANSNLILGDDNWAKKGWDSSEIELEHAPGVGLLLAEGDKPQRIKGPYIDDELLAELVTATIPLRPASPPGWPTPTGRTAPAEASEQVAP